MFVTPPAVDSDYKENDLYVSLWDDGTPVLSLQCREPCLPNIRKPLSNADPQSYRSVNLRELAPHMWEAMMHFEGGLGTAKPADDFTLRLDLRADRPVVEFDGRRRELRRPSFQDAAYIDYSERVNMASTMIFAINAGGREYLIKTARDDTFLYLHDGEPQAQTVRTRNWHYQLAVGKPKPGDEAGSSEVWLHGDILLPQGAATIDVDVIRTPESDVGLWLTRAHEPRIRFWQTNDANTSRFKACAAAVADQRPRCQILYLAEANDPSTCTRIDPAHRMGMAIWFDLAGDWRAFSADDTGHLLDRDCKIAYAIDYVGDTKVVLKDLAGVPVEFTKPPDSP